MRRQRADLLGLPAASEIVNCHSGCRRTCRTDIICPYYPPPLRPPPSASPLCFPSPLSAAFEPFSPRHVHVYEVPSSVSSASIPLLPVCHLVSFTSVKGVSLQQSLTTEAAATLSLFNGSSDLYRRYRVFGLLPVLPV